MRSMSSNVLPQEHSACPLEQHESLLFAAAFNRYANAYVTDLIP